MLLRVQQMKCPDNFWASTEERETKGLNWTLLRRSLPFPTLVQQVQIARHLYKGSSFIIRKKGQKYPNIFERIGHSDFCKGFAFIGGVKSKFKTVGLKIRKFEIEGKYPRKSYTKIQNHRVNIVEAMVKTPTNSI